MIKGINQSMVNRSIAGGVACKCINGNSISGSSTGNGVNGGKIEVGFTLYFVDEYERHIKKDDAERVFREILTVDPEKYMFYLINLRDDTAQSSDTGIVLDGPCYHSYNTKEDSEQMTRFSISLVGQYMNSFSVLISIKDGIIDYDQSTLMGGIIDNNVQGDYIIHTINLTLYYRER